MKIFDPKLTGSIEIQNTILGNVGIAGDLDIGGTITGNTTIDGNLTVDTDTLFVDSSSNRVGIGTSSPSAKLDVDGDAKVSGRLEIDVSAISGRENVLFGTISDSTPSKFGIANGTTATGQFVPAIYGYQSVDRNAFVYYGFGNSTYDQNTSDPLFVFSVSNASSSTDPLNNTLTAITQRDAFLFRTVTFDYMRIKANGDILLSPTNGTVSVGGDLAVDTNTLFVDASTNRVGIGTSSPDTLLNIASPSAPTLRIENTDISLTDGQVIGAVEFYTVDTSGAGSGVVGGMQLLSTNGTGAETSLTFGTSRTADGNNVERMRIDASGNVGIGTDSPQKTLDVRGTFAISSNNSSYWDFDRDDSDGSLKISDTNTERMRIDSSGNVGIGTDNPSAKIHAYSSGTSNVQEIVAVLGSNSNRPVLQFSESTAGNINSGMSIEYNGNGSGDSNYMVINSVANVPRLVIMSGGNVGIGTASPSTKLQVVGSTAGATVLDVQGTSGQLFSVTDDLTGEIFAVSDISGIPILSVDASGIVYVDNKVAVGDNQTVSGNASSVTGGACNTASGNCSIVGGGQANISSGPYSTVSGGFSNIASGNRSNVGGGDNNASSCNYATVAGGRSNCASNFYSTVGGGCNNTASGNRSTVGGGRFNLASGDCSTTGGGASNTASGFISTAGGGRGNCASGQAATISGGEFNTASGTRSSVVGGYGNTASCSNSVAATRFQTTSASCQLRVSAISKSSGTFRIDHPDPAKTCTHYLSHSFVESPNAGDNIYRYKVTAVNGQAVIQLPSYYKFLNENDQVWVTPQEHFGIGYGNVNEEQTELTITTNTDGEYNVLLIGTRKDFDAVHHWQGTETYK